MTYKLRLDKFEGPLDLLLHLIKLNEVDIQDIPISTITDQYIEYLEMMRELDLEIASEFLVMAATLMEIKSRMLLPVEDVEEEAEDDPRFELIEQILEYKKYKELAGHLESKAVEESGYFQRNFKEDVEEETGESLIEAGVFELLQAFKRVLEYATEESFREIMLEEVSVEERMVLIRTRLREEGTLMLDELLKGSSNSKAMLIATFLALLELVRLREIAAHQTERFGEIRLFLAKEE